MSHVEDELKSAQEGKNLLASMVVDLETQLEGAKASKAEAYVDNSSLANEVRRLEGAVAELTVERDGLIADSAKEKGVMSKSVDDLQAQLDGLIFERDAAEKAKRRSEDAWRLERQNLEEQLRKSRKFNDELNEQLATKELEHARALAEKQEARHVSRSERQMRELFEGHLAEAKKHQDVLRTRMRELEAEAAEATAMYHKTGNAVSSLQNRCSELETSKASVQRQAAATEALLAEEIKALKIEVATLSSECKTFKATQGDLKDMLLSEKNTSQRKTDEIASLSGDIKKMKMKLSDCNTDEVLMCQQVNQLKETVALLSKEKMGMLQQKSGEKETYMEELRVLRQALTMAEQNTEAALTQERTEKNQRLIELQDYAEQLAASKADVKSLQSQLDNAETAVAKALADKEELEGERRFLEGETRELTSQLASTRAEKEARDIEIAELQVLLRSQEVELQDDRGDLTRTKTDAAVMIRDQDEMRATFERLRDENELLHAQVAQLNDHLQNIEVNNRRLEMEVGTQAAQSVVAMQTQQVDRSEEYRGLVGENERMRDRILALEEELAQTIANKEVDRSILEEQLHHAEARAEKAELVDEIEDKLREALEEIARLESELVQTRAEAAERDIQWQAEVDALAETYEKLQMELKKRERDIEEMKEGAWLSAELQYMAKKVEDYEIAERKHIQEQKEILDKLEDKDKEIALMAAKSDEAAGVMRALEGELNDEKFTNKDLIREVHNLRLDCERAEEEKEKALAAAEKFVQRTVESTSADRETLKAALKELGSSLDTIRSNSARTLQERDAVISEKNAGIHKLKNDLTASEAEMTAIKKELALAQKMLKATMANSASMLGQTLMNHRHGAMKGGFKSWLESHVYSRLESKVEQLEYNLMLATNQSRMIALKQIMGRWKNQGLFMGWKEWREWFTDTMAEKRLLGMLDGMTAEERKKALARLQGIIDAWKGQNLRYMYGSWGDIIVQKRQREAKLKYAARKWYNAHLSKGFATWKYYATLGAGEQAQIEINELQWRLKRSLQSWMKDKFMYEARIFSESQKSRFFQCWAYHTREISKTTARMKLMLGTMKRDKARNAFAKFQHAVNMSRLHASDLLDQKLLADAKKKALQKMNRVIQHAKNAQIAAMWRSWTEFVVDGRLNKEQRALQQEYERGYSEGYKTCREEFEPTLAHIRSMLMNSRASAFAKYIDIFLTGNAKRGQQYCMGKWRSWVKDKSGREEEEARLRELERLKKSVSDLQIEVDGLKVENKGLGKQITDLNEDMHQQELEFRDKIKQMKINLDEAIRTEEMTRSQAELEKKHFEAMLVNKEKANEDLQEEIADAAARHQRAMSRMEQKNSELESNLEAESAARAQITKKSRELALKSEQEITGLRETETRAKASERRALADHQQLSSALKDAQASATKNQSDAVLLRKENQKLRADLDKAEGDMAALQTKLRRAQENLVGKQ
jgi:chromosome segregation ATPase